MSPIGSGPERQPADDIEAIAIRGAETAHRTRFDVTPAAQVGGRRAGELPQRGRGSIPAP